MPIKEITTPRFQTSDDQEFSNLADARAHQAQLDNADSIEAFCEAKLDNDRSRATARRLISEYLGFVESSASEPAHPVDEAEAA